MLNRLFSQAGFKWAVRAVGFVLLGCLVFANILMKPRLPPRKRTSLIEPRHLKDPAYAWFVLATALIMLGRHSLITLSSRCNR